MEVFLEVDKGNTGRVWLETEVSLVTYPECKPWVHALGVILPHGTPVNLSIATATRCKVGIEMYEHSQGIKTCMYRNSVGPSTTSFTSLGSVADRDPFQLDGCLHIEAALPVLHRPDQQ